MYCVMCTLYVNITEEKKTNDEITYIVTNMCVINSYVFSLSQFNI